MNDGDLSFRCDGPAAKAEAREFAALLRAELPEWTVGENPEKPQPSSPGERGLDWANGLLIALSLPPAVHYSMELARRAQLEARFERVVAWAKERRARGQRNPFVVLPPDQRVVPLDEARPGQLLDAAMPRSKGPAGGAR